MLSSYCRPTSRPPNRLSGNAFGEDIDNYSIYPSTPTETQTANPGLEEETPAEVALLLTSIRDISNEEILADPPIITELADAFPCFPELDSNKAEPNQEVPHPLKCKAQSTSTIFMQHEHDRKKSRSISLDSPEIHSVDEEDSPPLLQWRNIRGESTSPPFGYHHHSTPSPLIPRRNTRSSRLMARNNRPRAVSCAETKDHLASFDVARSESGIDKPLTLILRKKFSWKNYPEVS